MMQNEILLPHLCLVQNRSSINIKFTDRFSFPGFVADLKKRNLCNGLLRLQFNTQAFRKELTLNMVNHFRQRYSQNISVTLESIEYEHGSKLHCPLDTVSVKDPIFRGLTTHSNAILPVLWSITAMAEEWCLYIDLKKNVSRFESQFHPTELEDLLKQPSVTLVTIDYILCYLDAWCDEPTLKNKSRYSFLLNLQPTDNSEEPIVKCRVIANIDSENMCSIECKTI